MNVVLETLFLRRPRIEYISPAVCPIHFSASGIATFDQCFNDLSFCSEQKINDNFLNFQEPPDGLAYNVYYSTQETGQPFTIVNGGLLPGQSVIFTGGVYWFTVNTPAGESDPFPTTTTPGGFYVTLQMPQTVDAVSYNLYKDGSKIISGFTGAVVESSAEGWYQATKITVDGETPLSGCSALLLSGTVPIPPPPPPAGPNWCFDPIDESTPFDNAHTLGNFDGTFPPTYNLFGGWSNPASGMCFDGGILLTSCQSFNYVYDITLRRMPYSGPQANCRATIEQTLVGPLNNYALTFAVQKTGGFMVFSTDVTTSPLLTVPKVSGTYTVDFTIPAGVSKLYLEVVPAAYSAPGNGTRLKISFQNL